MLTTRDLIDRLGGPRRVGERCGISASAVSNWIARDAVAHEHRLTLWIMASEAGLEWSPPGAEGVRLATKTPRAA